MRREAPSTGWAAAAALLGLALVGAAVALRRTGAFDAWAAAAAREAASPAADAVARAATALASGPATLVALLVGALTAPRAGARRVAAVLVAAWGAGALATAALKALTGRARPSFPYTAIALPSPAFPSGHTVNAVVVFGALAMVAARRWPALRGPLLAGALAVALVAGLSRVYLGVHFPTDVLGGWALGAAILAAVAAALPPGPAPR